MLKQRPYACSNFVLRFFDFWAPYEIPRNFAETRSHVFIWSLRLHTHTPPLSMLLLTTPTHLINPVSVRNILKANSVVSLRESINHFNDRFNIVFGHSCLLLPPETNVNVR